MKGKWLLPALVAVQKVPEYEVANPIDENFYTRWDSHGVAVPSSAGDSLFLAVGVPGRVGYYFSKQPLLSKDFELTFKFSYTGAATEAVKQGFGIWLFSDDPPLSTEMQDVMRDAAYVKTGSFSYEFARLGYDLFGFKNKFTGLGAVFTTRVVAADGSSALTPTVVGMENAGDKTLYAGSDIPDSRGHKIPFRNAGLVDVKLSHSSSGTKIEVMDPKMKMWVTVLDAKPRDFPQGARIGFSYWGEKHLLAPANDVIKLSEISVNNRDSNYNARAIPAPVAKKDSKNGLHSDFLYEHGHLKEHRDESDAIHDLTNMVMKLVAETEPLRAEVERTIDHLSTRVEGLEKLLVELKSQIEESTGVKLDDEFQKIRAELSKLSKTASTEAEKRVSTINSLQADLDSMHTRAKEQHRKVRETLVSGHSWSMGLSFFAMCLILTSGGALYWRFRHWEKKHIL